MPRTSLLLCIFLLSIIGCSGTNEEIPLAGNPPINLTVERITSARSYLTLTVHQIEFLQNVGDVFGKGEFRLRMFVGDGQEISGGLFCPGGEPLEARPASGIVPCNLALSIPEESLGDELFVVIMGLDEDNGSTGTDLLSGATNNAVAHVILKAADTAYKARYGVAAFTGPGVLLEIGLSTVISQLGNELQGHIEKSDVIGFQVLYLARRDNWHIGEHLTFETGDGDLQVEFSIDRATTPGNIVIEPQNTPDTPPPTAKSSAVATVAPSAPSPSSTPRPTLPPPIPTISRSAWQQGNLAFLSAQNNEDNKALYLLDLTESENAKQIFTNNKLLLAPVLSPDGSMVVLYEPGGQLFLVNSQSGDSTISPHECTTPVWSADGNRILCRSANPATFDIINANTGAVIDQIARPSGSLLPNWSPVRDEVVFAVLQDGTTSIYRMSLDSGSSILLTGDATENYAPSWSPDGNWIAYQSNQGSSDSEIWIMDRNGQNAHRLTHTPSNGWSRAPYWSPDGQWLAFVSNRAGSIGADYGEVFIISVETEEAHQVTYTGGSVYDWRVSWSE